MTTASILWFAGLFALYFVPSMVAAHHQHHNGPAIFILNIFLGWTFIGWVAALIWAFTRGGAR